MLASDEVAGPINGAGRQLLSAAPAGRPPAERHDVAGSGSAPTTERESWPEINTEVAPVAAGQGGIELAAVVLKGLALHP